MSEISDKRRRTDLDLFVLALIADGVATPYELKQHAGLSPGATIPALDRLLAAGMVRQGKPGTRGRIEYQVTSAGAKSLRSSWQALIEKGPTGDPDSDLRVALVALWIGGDRGAAAEFLKLSASRNQGRITAMQEMDDGNPSGSLAEFYGHLRARSAIAMLKAQADAALEIARALSRKRIGKRTTQR